MNMKEGLVWSDQTFFFVSALPIFPGRRQPSIFGADELNCRVRNGNGWTLTAKDTNFRKLQLALYLRSSSVIHFLVPALPAWCTFRDSNPGPTD